MKLLDKIRSRGGAFSHDLLMIPVAWLGAYWLRFNLDVIPEPFLVRALEMLPVIVVIQGIIFWYFGLYRGVWRFASIPDLVRISKAVVFGVGLCAVGIFFITRMQGIPRSAFPLYGFLLLGLLGGPRFLYRWFKDHKIYKVPARKALIVGAGHAGEWLVRDLFRDTERAYEPIGFVDDNTNKRGKEIHGVRVVGGVSDILDVTKRHNIDIILIALPSATSRQMRKIVEICEKTALPFRTLPRIQDLVSGRVSVNELRQVSIEDLLGREPVKLDWQTIKQGLTEKVVLVTGGGGSIGFELCRQIAMLRPKKLLVFEQSEFNLYSTELELQRVFPRLQLVPILGDVCDTVAVEEILRTYKPDVIFHAAAYKHVPLLENQIRSAVLNNIVGTRNIASLADKHGCETFVLVSTDKAVRPGNVMGVTKRVAEIYCQNLARQSKTRYITVRFGNVLASAGSVIPLFQEQIAHGGPVTVTHRDITRYFMTIPEATQLILQASVIGKGREIYVLDMGDPVKIDYLARQLILLSGKQPDEDIEIKYTGLRPGEKMYEELFHDTESLADTGHPKILLAQSRDVDMIALEQVLDQIKQACNKADEQEIRVLLRKLVPELVEDEAAAEQKKRTEGAVIYPWQDGKSRKPH